MRDNLSGIPICMSIPIAFCDHKNVTDFTVRCRSKKMQTRIMENRRKRNLHTHYTQMSCLSHTLHKQFAGFPNSFISHTVERSAHGAAPSLKSLCSNR